MKNLLAIVFVLAMVFSASFAIAETVTLPNGQQIPLDGLTSGEKQNIMSYIDKISKAQKAAKIAAKEGILSDLTDVAKDPKALNEWRLLITGTIKDIAYDLNVTVNEFIKTPAGMAVAGLIIYKVAGKEVLSQVFDIVLIIPFWILCMSVLWVLQRKYFGCKLVFDTYTDPDSKKIVKNNPQRIQNYEFYSRDSRSGAAWAIYGLMVLVSFISLIVAFA
jgi:hypothetical protein